MWTPPRKDFPTLVNTFFKDPSYLTVYGNRPVIYLFEDSNTPEDLEYLRQLSHAAGLGDPYVIKAELGKGGGHTAGAACDGEMRSYWQAATGAYTGEWLEVDFAKVTTFDKSILVEPDGHTTGYEDSLLGW